MTGVNIYSNIQFARNEYIGATGRDPTHLILGERQYQGLCGYIGALEKSEKPIELREFQGLTIVTVEDETVVACGALPEKL